MDRAQIVTQFLSDAAAATGGQFIQNNNNLVEALQTLYSEPAVFYELGLLRKSRRTETITS
jgi:hypothetical protein